MPDSLADAAKIQEKLAIQYYKLPALERQMIQVLAIAYEPTNRSVFFDCLLQYGLKDKDDRHFTVGGLKVYVDRFLKIGLLIQERSQGLQCNPYLIDIAIRDAVKAGNFEKIVKAIEAQLPVPSYGKLESRSFRSESQFVREVRIGIYRQDLTFVTKQFEDFYRYGYPQQRITLETVLHQICTNPFDVNWFKKLKSEFYEMALSTILNSSVIKLKPNHEAFTLLQNAFQEQFLNPTSKNSSEDAELSSDRCTDMLLLILIEQSLLRADLETAQAAYDHLGEDYKVAGDSFIAWLNFIKGNRELAIAQFRQSLKMIKKATGKRQIYFSGEAGLFFILALIQEGTAESMREAESYAALMTKQTNHWLQVTYSRFQKLLKFQLGDIPQKELLSAEYIHDHTNSHTLEAFFSALCLYWINPEKARIELSRILEPLLKQSVAAGYHWLSMEAAELLGQISPNSIHQKHAQKLRQANQIPTIVNLIRPQETWELSLNALLNLSKSPQEQSKAATNSPQRLVWFITFNKGTCTIQPREQKINAKGVWSAGRNIAVKRLKDSVHEFPYMTPQDIIVCSHIQIYSFHGYYGQSQYEFDEDTICALIGHPFVFWEDSPTTRVEIVKGEPELLVKTGRGDRLILEFSPQLKDGQNFVVEKESPTRLKVTLVNESHRRITEIIGRKNRLEIPVAAKERVLAAIHGISSIVTVHSDIGGVVSNAEEVPSDSKPHVHILPSGDGLKVAVLARPFANAGAYYRPGTGGATVLAEIDGKRLQATRNLKEEKKLANEAIAACLTLGNYEENDSEWIIDDPEFCLELLLELQALGDRIVLEWPEGEKMRISHRAGFGDFRMSINQSRDWFAAEGELQLGDDKVLDMQRLLELLDKTPSRFIPLGDGQFLALTQQFRKRLDEFRRLSEKHGSGTRFHPLAALALEDFVDEIGDLKVDKHWKAHVKKIKEMRNFEPQFPTTLQADLRDYQIEGFQWLARLAHWGVGACLADDMGLGKTLQSLALILTRAPHGATLIVAPTSVCMNWIGEAAKFAPTLNVIVFGTGDRQKVLDNLQPFDMVICSYGLMQQEEVGEMLAKVQWQTIVLDEAQAIKNTATKRSQAAMNLQSSFKMITTGTPIENHLGELWNLFRFINPGLLGSLDNFNTNYANPIERSQDREARNQLKKLIQPFILRRTKNQVLQELPSRTEVTLQVELSKEELAFYEALRREAIAKLTDTPANAGQKHLQVLAEIMKLRRACCNTKLVRPDIPLPSSKLQLFGEVVNELLDNKHKALVFSQFVDHLHIIRDYLDSQKISYQYLDGSTPAKERKKRVEAFQAGEGDVFLISLKAGGTGLNLTAADYVIHMDPWWNPAVEDQASDRAHRIGQKRPVTIYRLVAKGTIEEKIVDLHHHKRDLADSLLEGTDMSGKVTTDALLQLINEI
ncbi:DEAD/DEAH box helicase [Pseudanabaena sp. FACHB-1998]|uniref:DEAD/DEAH box helicase n=1 Tax=Pseudanabaena sp. FACHB-1998 TaxID=2692858 RepID=UPI0016805F0D|nr:DEAD/DEAH box helicase [Pseudanabaena sp. FACHB-1998]MBD2175759.1 DEAD/DEAH box helicase [Pseudanabaena sp. FACHB-1998]